MSLTARFMLALSIASFSFLCGWINSTWRSDAEIANLQAGFEKERRAAAEAHAAALEAARQTEAQWQKQARESEQHYEQVRKQNAVALAAADAAHERLRYELRSAQTRLHNVSAAAGVALGDAALGIAGSCAVEYRLMGEAVAGCHAELSRVHGMWPVVQESEHD